MARIHLFIEQLLGGEELCDRLYRVYTFHVGTDPSGSSVFFLLSHLAQIIASYLLTATSARLIWLKKTMLVHEEL